MDPGKVVIPDKSSATFLSLVGNLDKRVKLDESIKNVDGRYFPALSVMAAKASYENEAYIKNVVSEHWEVSTI
ncbi:hypothetical protein RJ639_038858 [Escallonia herrerae]|uniref:Uncharacterized protein n=1 Tax=Escallonia herrerae TaxID=1293975 RepID=A0AA88WP98_9ASTE|nr:hypothetical protein RJ639_038858 [Escallonia herrerae]